MIFIGMYAKKINKKNNIIPQMHDVRPVMRTGDLDWGKIRGIGKTRRESLVEEKVAEVYPKKILTREIADQLTSESCFEDKTQTIGVKKSFAPNHDVRVNLDQKILQGEASVFQLGKAYKSKEVPIFQKSFYESREFEAVKSHTYDFLGAELPVFNFRKTAFSFAVPVLAVVVIVLTLSFFGKGLEIKGRVLGESNQAYGNILAAMENAGKQNFQNSSGDFNEAYQNFSEAAIEIEKMGNILVDATRYIPFASSLSSGKNVMEAGRHFSLAGESLSGAAEVVYAIGNPLNPAEEQGVPLLDIFKKTEGKLRSALAELKKAEGYLNKVKISDLPDDKQDQFVALKSKLPSATESIDNFLNNSHIFIDLLGGNGPRKYLFLFQNNQEMRATGGFIGTYGLMDFANGKVKKFFVDGIFNPDGQLREKIVPPKPIQKISAAWSMHDSNWFPDFPVSAEKAILFYEKTGGPTADGIITLTPTVMEKLLEITGPIEMPEYGVTLDSKNFIEQTQYEVEIDYDIKENKPKKILSDLAPIILNRVFNARDIKSVTRTLGVVSEALNQKHILLYAQDKELQEMISAHGWSGEVLDTPRDYISVINTNINGFKTDGVINETIEHAAEIQSDGSIIDTLTITRSHNGGNTGFAWWNGVNADYMRVYVPEGSTLLEAEGQTRETVELPLAYDELGFKRDPQVEAEEKQTTIHEASGTRIYIDAKKTVFANWVYVSPQEKVVLKYKYLLPFKIKVDLNNPSDSYSLLAQKQSGSSGSVFVSRLSYPNNLETKWTYPDGLQKGGNSLKLESRLDVDRFSGVVFTPR